MASTVIGVILVVWTALAGWTAAQQQQQQPAALPSALADEVFTIINTAVQQELRPIVRRFESLVESLDNRLTLLDSRMSTLTAHVLTNRLGEQMEELSSQLSGITARLDSQQSQLNSQLSQLSELNTHLNEQKTQQEETAVTVNSVTVQLDSIVTQQDQLTQTSQLATRLDSQQLQLNEQKSQQDQTAATVNNVTAQLDGIVTQQGDQLTQTSQLATRLDSQESQLNDLNTQLNEQKTTQNEASVKMDNYTSRLDTSISRIDKQEAKLSGAINDTSFQQKTIDDLAATVKQLIPHPGRDCSDLPVDSPSGVYLLRPSGDNKQPPVEAYCDMDTAGGNWTVFQRRDNIEPRQDFYLGWKEYKDGFGDVTQEFWWGLEHLFQLTSSDRQYELRVDLEAFDGSRAYAVYQGFRISSEEDGYKLSVSNYSGPARDSLYWSVNKKFSTRDRDQDGSSYRHCAQQRQGAWWYGGCGWSSLNGRYRDGGNVDHTGIWWWTWRDEQSLKKSEMKIRPT